MDLFRPRGGNSLSSWIRFFRLLTSDRTIIVQIRIIKNPNVLFINTLGNFIVESEGIEPSSKHAIKERSTSLVFV
jgi:hypothetical protein